MTPLTILLSIADSNTLTADAFARALNAAKVKNSKPNGKPLKIPDGGGLALYVPPTGAKTWRYRFRLGSKEQTLTIGGYPEVSLEFARKAHRAARWLVERGESPLAFINREFERLETLRKAAILGTFKAVAEEWISATNGALAPRTSKHRRAMIDKYVLPELGDKPIGEISRKVLTPLLSKIDQVTPETAKHCRIYIKQIFDYALDHELVLGNPTPLAKILINRASRKPVPRKALGLNRLGDFLKILEDAPHSDPRTKSALKLLILTWTRTSEVTSARWKEFDLDAGIWLIPAERMKADEPHTIYLSRQAVNLLRELNTLTYGEYLFPNLRDPQRPMGRTTLTEWRKRWGFAGEMEVHGFRALSSTWANESGKYRSDVIEVALAHKEQDRVRAAYNRAQFVGELRQLWQDWADVCDKKERAAREAGSDAAHEEV
jgi:integrase